MRMGIEPPELQIVSWVVWGTSWVCHIFAGNKLVSRMGFLALLHFIIYRDRVGAGVMEAWKLFRRPLEISEVIVILPLISKTILSSMTFPGIV